MQKTAKNRPVVAYYIKIIITFADRYRKTITNDKTPRQTT